MMNLIRIRHLFLIVIFTLSLFSPLLAQSDFEGKIKIEISSKDETSVLNYFKKGNSARIEVTADQTGVMIFKPDKTLMLIPGEKVYMEFDESLLDMAAKYGGAASSEENLKEAYNEIDKYKTGETKIIHGYNCEKYFKTDELNETEMWMTNELGKFLFMPNPAQGDSWMSEISNKSFFPMLVISRDLKSGEVSRLEVIEISQESLSDDFFDVPSGYQKMTMPVME